MTRSTTAETPRRMHVSFNDAQIQEMLNLLKVCPLPEEPPVNASQKWELGMDLEYLKGLRDRFVNEWRWSDLEGKLNKFENWLVDLEEFGFRMHFVHVRSKRQDAVPLVLVHGWPGTVFDFHKVIEKLVDPPQGQRAFHVVAPSLPGFFLSTLPKRVDWKLDDTALAVNHLMVNVLGYDKYVMQGGDYGTIVLRVGSSLFPEHATFTLYNMLKVPSEPRDNFEPATFAVRKNLEQRKRQAESGMGYFTIQRTKPFTIGYAIGTSPLSILAYIGEKFQAWTDPSCLDPMDIIDTTALYFLSGCFPTSVMAYQQGTNLVRGLKEDPKKWSAKSKIGFSVYPYEIGNSPVEDLKIMGEVVFYSEHDKGGHFPALEVPDEFVDDARRCFAKV